MGAFILTWKEDEWDYSNIAKMIDEYQQKGFVERIWRVFAHVQAEAGDKAFLLKQLPDPRGIFGAGTLLDAPKLQEDDTDPGPPRWRAQVRFTLLADPRGKMIVPLNELQRILPDTRINANSSGHSRLSESEEELLTLSVLQSRFARSETERKPQVVGTPTTGPVPSSWTRAIIRDAERPSSTYALQFGHRNVWKVGHAMDVNERLADINTHIPHEITGEKWEIRWTQKWPLARMAYEMEQKVLNFSYRLRTSGERLVCSQDDIRKAWEESFLKVKQGK